MAARYCYNQAPPTSYAFRCNGQSQCDDRIARLLVKLSDDIRMLVQFACHDTLAK